MATGRLHDTLFVVLHRIDEACHAVGWTCVPLCRLVGRMEPAYYERGIDWDNPIYRRYMPEDDEAKFVEHGYKSFPDIPPDPPNPEGRPPKGASGYVIRSGELGGNCPPGTKRPR